MEDPKLLVDVASMKYSDFVGANEEKGWCEFEHHDGEEKVEEIYRKFLSSSTVPPNKGFILTI